MQNVGSHQTWACRALADRPLTTGWRRKSYCFNNVTLTLLLISGGSVPGLSPLNPGVGLCGCLSLQKCDGTDLYVIPVWGHKNAMTSACHILSGYQLWWKPTTIQTVQLSWASMLWVTTEMFLRPQGEREMPSLPQLLQFFSISTPATRWSWFDPSDLPSLVLPEFLTHRNCERQ